MISQHDADSVFVLSHPDVCFTLPFPQPGAQLAHFRQLRAKSESSGAQKKTPKRKGQTVQTNDRSTEERHLEQLHPDVHHGDFDKGHSEVCPFLFRVSFPNFTQCFFISCLQGIH